MWNIGNVDSILFLFFFSKGENLQSWWRNMVPTAAQDQHAIPLSSKVDWSELSHTVMFKYTRTDSHHKSTNNIHPISTPTMPNRGHGRNLFKSRITALSFLFRLHKFTETICLRATCQCLILFKDGNSLFLLVRGQ